METRLYKNLKTNLEWFYHWEKTTPDKIFLRQPEGENWITFTFKEAGEQARKMTSALKNLGLQKRDHIAILSKNCYHWILADLAIMMGGFVSVPYYASLPKAQLAEIIQLSDIKAIFFGKLEKWGDKSQAIPQNVHAIRFPHYEGNAKIEIGHDWDELIEKNNAQKENFIPSLDDLWTILFTSGTTGQPKGVMHKHSAPALIMRNEKETNWIGIFKYKDHKFFSFLPLNHVAERIGVEVTSIRTGGTISFAESIDTFAKNLQETQPTFIFAVPRIWTKFYLGVIARMPQKKLSHLLKIPIVSGIVKKKIRTALGLRDIKIAGTGAAITPQFIKEWYKSLGIHLVEAYGMTEVCGSITNGPDASCPSDSVGRAVPNCEVKIHPETQEILMKSICMMSGYYKDPVKTAEVLKGEWLHSGDRGTMDEHGYVRVVGRVKDAFKTSKGQFIIPNPIEEQLAKNDFIEQVCVAGLTVPQPLAVVNLSDVAKAVNSEIVENTLLKELSAINNTLPSYQKISTLIIDREVWSEENEMLTPTLKVRRGKIDDRFRDKYVAWHEDQRQIIWGGE